MRELRNVVERSVYRLAAPEKKLRNVLLDPFAAARVAPAANPAPSAAPSTTLAAPALAAPTAEPGDFAALTRAYEETLLKAALERCRFNQAEAARQLGLTYYQFRHHLRLHGLLGKAADAA